MRLIGILAGTLLALFIGLASVHFYGLGKHFSELDHKFLKLRRPWIATHWEQNFFLEKNPEIILVATVYRSQDNTLLVSPSSEKVYKNSQREQTPNPARPLLKDLLEKFPQTRFILNITDNLEDIDRQVAAVLEKETRSERILIQSDYNLVMESIKTLQPMQLFGSTPADTMRFKAFDSMGIVSATPFKGDVYFTPLKIRGKITINEDIARELKRRHKPIILGPLDNPEDADLALRLGADGLYAEKPEWLLQWLSQHPH